MKEFDSITDAVSYLRTRCPDGAIMPDDGCEWVDYSDFLPEDIEWFDFDRDFPCGRIMPPQLSPFLYRGQTKRFSPCRPSVFRSLPMAQRPRELARRERLVYFLSEVRTCWFKLETRKHPAYEFGHKIGLQIDAWSLAQHYGIPTHHLDLTQSVDVAAFFATCSLDKTEWQPCTEGVGVIYALNFSAIPESWNYFKLVGLSTFPRPGEQKAWTVPLNLKADFEKWSIVEIVQFKHTRAGSEKFHSMFAGGESLFPYDPAHDLAMAIVASKTLPVNCVANGLRGLGCPLDRLQFHYAKVAAALRDEFGLQVENEVPVGLSDQQVAKLTEYWEKKGKSFLENVGVRPVAMPKRGGPWIDTQEAAQIIGCTPTECRKLIRSGKLECIRATRLGGRRPRYFVARESAENYVRSGRSTQ